MTKIDKLKKQFQNKALLTRALTHKSWVNENKNKRESNERLEFLGDAVLEFIVSKELYKRFPQKEEGFLTTLRAKLVNTTNLAQAAEKLGLGKEMFLSKGEEEGGGRTNPSLLADTMEAVIGALFLDQGIETTLGFVKDNLLYEIPEKISQPLKDPKSRLQEYVQAKGLPAPRYYVLSESGPDHAKKFEVQVKVQDKVLAKGVGKSKNEASQMAAGKALQIVIKK
jgi:ribonuclease-3